MEQQGELDNEDKDKLAKFYDNLQEAIKVDGEVDPLVAETITNW